MKAIKRIIAVFLLLVTIAVVGYLVYTADRAAALTGDENAREAGYAQTEFL